MLLIVCPFQAVVSQIIEIEGKIYGNDDIENIHVINKTAKQFTITDQFGDFKINAKLGDTLVFSSVQYQTKEVVVDTGILIKKVIGVTMVEKVNELDEVIVGKVLTGDLLNDIKNIEGKPPINFYDVGIPGYTGKIATQSERKLNEATTGANGQKLKWYSPLTGSIPLNPIINGISGRTKMLKQRVALETKDELMYSIKARLSEDFLSIHPLSDDLVNAFFYFCAEDENFMSCKNKSDLEIFLFLEKKYNEFLKELELKQD